MKKLLLMGIILLPSTFTLQAETHSTKVQKKINFGQTIFRKKLQRKCGYTAGHWAQQHTLVEWKMIHNNEWIEPLYLFATEYAKDTGNRPRC